MSANPTLNRFAFVGLGANLPGSAGNPADSLLAVIPALRRLSAAPLLLSSFYESDPKDCPPGSPRYVNAVAGLLPQTDSSPESLLRALQQLEHDFGRVRSGIVNEARTMDLDLLSYADEVRDSAFLTLPHPRAATRRFVLEPWSEIAGGDWPLQGRTLSQWLQQNEDPPLLRLETPRAD